jgi:hypothetical protein
MSYSASFAGFTHNGLRQLFCFEVPASRNMRATHNDLHFSSVNQLCLLPLTSSGKEKKTERPDKSTGPQILHITLHGVFE